ncbi:MAG TPA: DUF742 domain-containing protein [Acidimicrobiia bacterium]|nr:DUF742 domain-containing protein [Acidimicrobiia bacterium]
MSAVKDAVAQGRLVRPYTMTGGRTGRELPPIALEALVSATPAGHRMKDQFRWEASRIIDLTRRETALVELAARLDVPIGVVRVVVSDLVKRGAVQITEPHDESVGEEDGLAYASLLKKVLDGIQSL